MNFAENLARQRLLKALGIKSTDWDNATLMLNAAVRIERLTKELQAQKKH